MSGKTISKDELKTAVEAYATANGKQVSEGDTGKFTIFEGTPNPGDPIVWLEDGQLRGNDIDFCLSFAEEFIKAPKEATKSPSKGIMPSEPRKSNGEPKNGLAVRDIQVQDMTFEDIKNFLCPAASDKDAYMFLQLCKARNLNPFCNEAYLIPYEDKKTNEIKCSMIVGKEAFMRKAEQHVHYRGFKAGVIVSKGEDLIYREGTFVRKGETLEGGWSEVYRDDRNEPIRSEVALSEYNKGFSVWNDKKATMIRKVAVVQSHREAFPSDLAGCYSSDEMGLDPDREVAV